MGRPAHIGASRRVWATSPTPSRRERLARFASTAASRDSCAGKVPGNSRRVDSPRAAILAVTGAARRASFGAMAPGWTSAPEARNRHEENRHSRPGPDLRTRSCWLLRGRPSGHSRRCGTRRVRLHHCAGHARVRPGSYARRGHLGVDGPRGRPGGTR